MITEVAGYAPELLQIKQRNEFFRFFLFYHVAILTTLGPERVNGSTEAEKQKGGQRLLLAFDTVKGHNRRIYDKLPVQRRAEAAARARDLGLVYAQATVVFKILSPQSIKVTPRPTPKCLYRDILVEL